MSTAARVLLASLALLALIYVWRWARLERTRTDPAAPAQAPRLGSLQLAIGFITNFFDTLGVGSFAPTTSIYKLLRLVPDERIPGTLNAEHALPTVTQALIFIAAARYERSAAVGLALGGIPGVLIAAYVVKSLPVVWLRWLVVVVVLYTALAMLRAAIADRKSRLTPAAPS